MEVMLRKMGNSTALIVPPTILRGLNIAAGQCMALEITVEGSIVLTPKRSSKRKYTLAALIAQCDVKAAPPADLALWDNARPVGNEVW
jgi:antitoxin ChpS